ncbi:MAG: dihydroorotate dehydrogenase [bacterium]|nr:dihydroorotate dehydrogenase [bacterium]
MNLKTKIGRLVLQNPILVASGCFGYGEEYAPLLDLSRLGGVVTKGISLKPRPGNSPPRLAETPAGLLNSIGLENVGVDRFIEEKLPFLRKQKACVLVNIFGESLGEYRKLAEILDDIDGIAGLEVNISCPNVEKGGLEFGVKPDSTRKVIETVRGKTSLPVLAKLSPNVTDIVEIARAAMQGGADGLTLINTLKGMAIDVKTRCPKLARGIGGLSGPAIRPVAVRMVYEVSRKLAAPVIGAGGIDSTEAALEFFIAGAGAVQIGTGFLINPRLPLTIIPELVGYLDNQGLKGIESLVGNIPADKPKRRKK